MDYRTEASNQQVRLHSREVTEAETEQRGADSRKTGGIKKGWEVNLRNSEVQQRN